MSNGKKQVKEIFDLVYGNKVWEEYTKYLIQFIDQAINKKDIFLLSFPEPVKVEITGSSFHFFPLHLACELTYACQLKCKHCYANAGKNVTFIDTTILKKFLSDLKQKGLRIVELTGGEPLLHPDFWNILEFSVKKFDYVAVLTNGISIGKKEAHRFSEYKDKILMNISLDGSSSKINDHYRGLEGAFEKTVNSIKLLSNLGLVVRVTMSVYPATVGNIEATLLLAKELGARSFVWGAVLPFGRGKEVIWDKNKGEEIVKIEKMIIDKYIDFIQWIPKKKMERMMNTSNCGAGWRSVVIDPYGNLRPCLLLSTKELNLGNIKKSSVEEIFCKDIFAYLYNLSCAKKEICGECNNLPFCEFCFARPLTKYDRKNPCIWARSQRIQEIFNLE